MRIVARFDPATETSETFNAGFSNGSGRIVVYNQSPQNLDLSWDAFSTYCPAWTAMLYCITASSVNLNWVIQTTLESSAPPISQVTVEAFDANETIMGTYPAPLNHQLSLGNSVPLGTSATSIQNDGNTAGTPILEATVLGDVGSAVSLSNDAVMVLGNAAHQGSLTLHKLFLAIGSFSRISLFGGTGVVNNAAHGLGTTPAFIFIMYVGNFGVTPGHPIYYYGLTATTVNVVADSSYSWLAVAIAF